MYLVERPDTEEHFTEGEPDLEPPEELAVSELDDDTLLEEDLDSEVVLEQDVDEDVLEATLEDLAHLTDDDADDTASDTEDAEDLDADTLDIADVEESLDRILRQRLAQAEEADEPAGEDSDDFVLISPVASPTAPLSHEHTVEPCQAGEFVCRGCFLVRSRVQLADAAAPLCLDCAG
ncbi:MAG TPA: DUF4193 family protein [Acidimicrobiales bacterium]|nr:DUF4193 family protein [Acidimicrobiales bacterium]